MPSIGGLVVTTWMGRLHPAKRIVSRVDPLAGVDGNVVTRSGWRALGDRIRTSVSIGGGVGAAIQLRERYRGLEGEQASAIDQFGETWLVTVLSVDSDISATFFSNTYRVVAEWLLLPASEEP